MQIKRNYINNKIITENIELKKKKTKIERWVDEQKYIMSKYFIRVLKCLIRAHL